MIVVGDIGGQYEAFKKLIEKINSKSQVILLGDLNDRGPQSKEVIQYAIDNKHNLVQSNHGHMMVDYYYGETGYYEPKLWVDYNGGKQTLLSYGITMEDHYEMYGAIKRASGVLPKEHIDYLRDASYSIIDDKFLFTHAPLHIGLTIVEASDIGTGFHRQRDYKSDDSLIWNRYVPNRPHPNGRINVFGHNASDEVKIYGKHYPEGLKVDTDKLKWYIDKHCIESLWGICLDTSGSKKLTALDTETMILYSEGY
jgi:serine/threonine protein phosphatase 1